MKTTLKFYSESIEIGAKEIERPVNTSLAEFYLREKGLRDRMYVEVIQPKGCKTYSLHSDGLKEEMTSGEVIINKMDNVLN